MALITISHLGKSFGEVVAVDKLTREIAEGS
jgi:ABC-type branched-subunit amino acid transport system ATPase component